MDLQTLRISRTPVSENSKCNGCCHYDGNAQAHGGACEVGQAPALCGTGTEPKYGYAPLDELAPDEIDDLATPQIAGQQGAMNEHGAIEKMVVMKRVVLGDDDLTIAQRIHGELSDIAKKSYGYAQGEVNMFAGAELAQQRYDRPEHPMITVAKSLHDMYMAPRKQHKYGVTDVLEFLKAKGMPVTDEDMSVCKSRFGETRKIKVPTMKEATEHLQQHNAANRPPGGGASAGGASPNARQKTEAMPIMKSMPNVRKLESADPFAKRR